MDNSKIAVVVSVLMPFLLKVSKRVSSSVKFKSDHSNCSHQAQLTASRRRQVHKENALTETKRVETEGLDGRRAHYCKEKNVLKERMSK